MALTTKRDNFSVDQQQEYDGSPSAQNGGAAGGPGLSFHNQKLMSVNYPNSPIHAGNLTPAERAEAFQALVLDYDGVGSYYTGKFSDGTDFSFRYEDNGAPIAEEVAAKINPYMPDQSIGNNADHKTILTPPHESIGHGPDQLGTKVQDGRYPSVTSTKSGNYNPLDPVSDDGYDGTTSIENV